jgi:ketosteroid isomerase-like protein
MISGENLNKINSEIKRAALDHLHAKDAKEALDHFTNDVVAVSNEKLFPSFQALAEDVKAYYEILKEVRYADWDDIHIQMIDENAATFTAKFRYDFTTTDNEKVDLKGIWTALYVRENDDWKIRLRHESFSQL